MKNFILGFLLAAVLASGGFFAYTRWSWRSPGTAAETAATRYHCPMHPTYISEKPGDCPICGMKLVPIDRQAAPPGHGTGAAAPAGAEPESNVPGYATVTIPEDRLQMMGITLAEARHMELDQSIRTFGRVTYDETRVHHVHTKFEGFIEHLFADYVGQYVKRGQPLFSIYSPELFATQREYLLALRAQEQMPVLKEASGKGIGDGIDLLAAARQRLALWDISEKQIRQLEETRTPFRALTIHSPVAGYVTAKTAVHGLRVMPGDNLYDVVDLSIVWVLADVYEVSLPFVRRGLPATMTLPYLPGRTWRGRVVFMDPTLDPATRTVKARLEFPNRNGELKPEMYAEVVIGGARARGIVVPESAVISTGERNIVFVAQGGGVFEPREVVTGGKVRDLWEIRQGVADGEQVVTGANFLLDSESKLKASTSGTAGHKH
jgi:Cu(I)/Ag(I) efflux system membrane fusion protein